MEGGAGVVGEMSLQLPGEMTLQVIFINHYPHQQHHHLHCYLIISDSTLQVIFINCNPHH